MVGSSRVYGTEKFGMQTEQKSICVTDVSLKATRHNEVEGFFNVASAICMYRTYRTIGDRVDIKGIIVRYDRYATYRIRRGIRTTKCTEE